MVVVKFCGEIEIDKTFSSSLKENGVIIQSVDLLDDPFYPIQHKWESHEWLDEFLEVFFFFSFFLSFSIAT